MLAALLAIGGARGFAASLLEEYTVRRWTTDDGLPESRVTRAEQSADGFLWCTTPRHHVRFDGARFVTTPHEDPEDGAPPSVSADDTPPGYSPADVTLRAHGTGTVVWALARGEMFVREDGAWRGVPLRRPCAGYVRVPRDGARPRR